MAEADADPQPDLAEVVPLFPMVDRPSERDPADGTTPRLREVVGDVLRDERHAQGRTLADVADDAAVSLPYLSEVERGRKEVSSDVLRSIGDALDLPLIEILDRCVERLRVRADGGSGIQLRAA